MANLKTADEVQLALRHMADRTTAEAQEKTSDVPYAARARYARYVPFLRELSDRPELCEELAGLAQSATDLTEALHGFCTQRQLPSEGQYQHTDWVSLLNQAVTQEAGPPLMFDQFSMAQVEIQFVFPAGPGSGYYGPPFPIVRAATYTDFGGRTDAELWDGVASVCRQRFQDFRAAVRDELRPSHMVAHYRLRILQPTGADIDGTVNEEVLCSRILPLTGQRIEPPLTALVDVAFDTLKRVFGARSRRGRRGTADEQARRWALFSLDGLSLNEIAARELEGDHSYASGDRAEQIRDQLVRLGLHVPK